MTSNTEARAAALADFDAAMDQAQQVFRAAIEGPAAEYAKATEPARAELDAAEDVARRAYLKAVGQIGAGP